MRKALLGSALLGVGLVAACAVLLPERYAVNLPVWGYLFGAEPPPRSELQRRIQLPPGFSIDLFAQGIRNARFLRFTSSGDLLVSSPRESSIFLLSPDRDGDGQSDGRRTLLSDLNRPHGMDLREGWLYVGETDAIRRVRFDAQSGQVSGKLETVVSDLPAGGNHWSRTIRFGPDGWLYVSIGSSCNACIEEDPRRAAIVRYRPDGSDEEILATGLRNSVGFDWQPGSGALYATDNGRDFLGDDVPPCELNRVVKGGFYGWPHAFGWREPDPDFGPGHAALVSASRPPVHGFVAHTAPLGIVFYRGEAFPERYRGHAFVAQHGSWNRSEKSGYRVVALEWDSATGAIRESDFAVGFELDGQVVGRPVDVAVGPEGALYISDDYAGVVYRVTYRSDRG